MECKIIRLNFLPFTNQEITLNIYRQQYCNQPKQTSFYRARLPKEPCNYIDYWVTMKPEDDFEKYVLKGKDNKYLTLNLIWDILLQKVENTFNVNEYVYDNKKFTKSISFILQSHIEGNEELNIEPYYLKSKDKLGLIINYMFKSNHDYKFNRKIQQLSLSLDKNCNSNINYYSDKYDKVVLFFKLFKSKLFPLTLENQEVDIENSMLPIESHQLDVKTYIFKDGQCNKSQFGGIKNYGPLVPLKKDPLFIFLFKEDQRDIANEIYKTLIGKAYSFTFNGMQKMFNVPLSKNNIEKINFESYDMQDLKKVEEKLLLLKEKYQDKSIIGIFIERLNNYSNDHIFSPYYFMKYIFTKSCIPLQAITIERIKGKDGLKWSASGIGLQIFSKLGGIPWKVKPSNDDCIILGIGSSHIKDHDGKILKYFAYSVCMDTSGVYKKVNVLGENRNQDEYLNQLESNLTNVIIDNLDSNIKKCIIHLPFKIKYKEINKIYQCITSLNKEYNNIEFHFIKINVENKFFGYADNNSKVPYESSYIELANNEYLVWFEGLQYGKENVSRKTGNPVHIQFLDKSDLDQNSKRKYLQDIINLSGANWRGFNAKLSPISIYYPELISKYISHFREYQLQNDKDIVEMNTPWFL